MKKISALAGAGGSSQGTLVAGGSVIQAKLVAVAATTVVAGGAAAENARPRSNDEPVSATEPWRHRMSAAPTHQHGRAARHRPHAPARRPTAPGEGKAGAAAESRPPMSRRSSRRRR